MNESQMQDMDLETELAESLGLSGFRLQRLEIYNWGTFHGQVRMLYLHGKNCLMTGDIGSGKSTVVDAITTLLMPHSKVSYNKAAGADSKERNLLSYVLGHYKSEKHESSGTAKPVALRDHNSYSVILGVFHNEGYDQTITLAQVFWMKDIQGTPARMFACAEKDLSIAQDFSNFGIDISGLRKKLKLADVETFDTFPPYGAWFRRRFGISGEQAMELFHQTVSMKSVGNLTDFVRTHMLEPFDVATRLKALIGHFDDLNRAHEAVLKAARQVELLTPLVESCRNHNELSSKCETLRSCRDALKVYFSNIKRDLLQMKIAKLEEELLKQASSVSRLKNSLDSHRATESELKQNIAENGGDRIDRLTTEIKKQQHEFDQRKQKFDWYSKHVAPLGVQPPHDLSSFEQNQKLFAEKTLEAEEDEAQIQNDYTEASATMVNKRAEHSELAHEIESLRTRRSNIPKRQIDMRLALCSALNLSESELPYAGELLQLHDKERDWEGAAERVLHNFGLSLLVPDEHYADVCDWVDRTHLKGRIVYFRVRDNIQRERPELHQNSLAKKLSIKPNSNFYEWLERELANRFDYACCDTQEQFRREVRAITQAGQIKSKGNRHEKDDTRRIDDRSGFILGWSNETKLATLESKAKQLEINIQDLAIRIASMKSTLDQIKQVLNALSKLEEYRNFHDIDWSTVSIEISRLEDEKKKLESASDVLRHLTEKLNEVIELIAETDNRYMKAFDLHSKLEEKKSQAEASFRETQLQLDDPSNSIHHIHFDQLDQMRAEALDEKEVAVESCIAREQEYRNWLQTKIDSLSKKISALFGDIIRAMSNFNNEFQQDTSEIDASIESADEYAQMLNRLESDDLPRFQARFKDLLNENTIREVAQFQSQLAKEKETIKERITKINESLINIDYNEGRYIAIEAQLSQDAEIRDFQTELRSCTEGSITGSDEDQYSESKFIQVKAIIERFRGREGQTEQDERWTKRVTDVRNWFFFGASERYREDDSEFEHYSDSGGKSGGQKEKLAYTILAASLAYQFGLGWQEGRSRSFRFVVIDEAFGRGSDDSTKFGLSLFKQLQLQLLVVTPMQKVKVIEPFVSSVGFVHNDGGRASKIRNMTIEEYHTEKEKLFK